MAGDALVNWLFLDLNAYFASVEQEADPALRGRPVAVVPARVDTTVCIAVSYEAKAFGIRTGTRVGEARALCPSIRLVEARHRLYGDYHHRIVAAVDSCVPVEEVLSIDEMACRLTGSQRAVDAAVSLAGTIKETIGRRVGSCLKCSIGLAPNRYLAKVASEMQKPDGLTVLRRSDLPQALYGLSPRDLPGIGPQMERRLMERGIHRLEPLCALDVSAMRELWGGVWGERFHGWLRGDDVPEPPSRHRSLSQSHVLEPERRSRLGAGRVGRALLNEAAVRLRKENSWTTGLSVALKYFRGREAGGELKWERRRRLEETQDTPTLLKAFDEIWALAPAEPPYYVGVTLEPLVPAGRHIPSLFGNPKREKLSRIMDEINRKHGREMAWFASLQAARPDPSSASLF